MPNDVCPKWAKAIPGGGRSRGPDSVISDSDRLNRSKIQRREGRWLARYSKYVHAQAQPRGSRRRYRVDRERYTTGRHTSFRSDSSDLTAHRSSSLQSRRARHGTSSCLPRIPKPDSETGSSAPVSSCAFPSTPSSSFFAFLAALGSFLLALPPPSVLRYCSHSLLLSSSRPSASRSGAPSRTPPSPPPPRCL